MKHRIAMGVFSVAVLVVSSAIGGGALKSGLQTGEKLPGPFHPLNATGGQAGKKHCLV